MGERKQNFLISLYVNIMEEKITPFQSVGGSQINNAKNATKWDIIKEFAKALINKIKRICKSINQQNIVTKEDV